MRDGIAAGDPDGFLYRATMELKALGWHFDRTKRVLTELDEWCTECEFYEGLGALKSRVDEIIDPVDETKLRLVSDRDA